jgi:signal transduction histidine kinase
LSGTANKAPPERERTPTNEEAALRRVATLVAQESSPVEIFAAVTEEACRVLESEAVGLLRFEPDETATLLAQSETPWDPPPLGTRFTLDGENVVAQVFRTGRGARVDDWTGSTGSVAAMANALGVRSAVATPVVVEGRLWGTIMAATSQDDPLPSDTENRIEQFTDLVATAIANAEARGKLSQLADEQAALRRIAVLVAQQPSPEEVFTAVTGAVGPLLGADLAAMHAFRGDGVATVIGGWSAAGPMLPIGTQLPLDGDSAVARIFHTGAAARIDGYSDVLGETAETARELRLRTAVGAPILVEGKLWGALMAATRGDEPLPPDAEARIAAFTELVATAVANAQAREDLRRVADEQAGLRRIATLVASGVEPEQVFAAVTDETAAVFRAIAAVMRFEHDPPGNVIVGVSKETGIPIGTRWPFAEGMTSAEVYRTGRSARLGAADWASHIGPVAEAGRRFGVTSQVACPIIVEGVQWGVITLNAGEELPPDTERRLEKFTELVTTAIANAAARTALRAVADEQGALRRVATLVAASAAPPEVFAAVTAEIARVLGADASLLCRADPDGAGVVVGAWGENTPALGTRIPRGGTNLTTIVLDTGHSARIESYDGATGGASEVARSHGLRSAVGAPVLVEGLLWGLVIAGTTGDQPLPPDAEERLAGFTELVATAVANASARAELVASRARIVAAGDEARRRIERDLHDGTQQRLIALGLDLQRARACIPEDQRHTHLALVGVEDELEAILADLRELSHGLHPPLLARAGLRPSLRALARRSPIPVELDIDLAVRPSPLVEIAVYYVVSEALTNAIKHSRASSISVTVTGDHAEGLFALDLLGHHAAAHVYATIADDGVGGAEAGAGSGLTGLADRVDALGGRLGVDSPIGQGTRISVELPLEVAAVG